jgi:hypothetical protein
MNLSLHPRIIAAIEAAVIAAATTAPAAPGAGR